MDKDIPHRKKLQMEIVSRAMLAEECVKSQLKVHVFTMMSSSVLINISGYPWASLVHVRFMDLKEWRPFPLNHWTLYYCAG